MDQRGDEVHTSTTEVSAGSREGVVRWVLLIGLVLIIVAFAIIVMSGAFSQDEKDSHQNIGRQITEQKMGVAAEGEPIMPAPETSGAETSGSTPPLPHPDAQSTPGDAPAGDPRIDAE